MLNISPENLKDINDAHEHEVFAVTLLLCTPSAVGRAWTNNDSLDQARQELAKLPLSEDLKTHAVQLMQDLKGVKSFFKGIADINLLTYDGPEPHPGQDQAVKIVRALRDLDK